MKNLLFVLLLFLAVCAQAQQTVAVSEVDHELIDQATNEVTKLQEIELKLETLKKENLHLKMLMDKHHQCLKGDQKNHEEKAGLNVDKARRHTIKRKSNQNTLPPPL